MLLFNPGVSIHTDTDIIALSAPCLRMNDLLPDLAHSAVRKDSMRVMDGPIRP